jgi:hypothetical protein
MKKYLTISITILFIITALFLINGCKNKEASTANNKATNPVASPGQAADEGRTIQDSIDKVQEISGSTRGQVSTIDGEWIQINTKTNKERDEILEFFSKVQASGEKIEIYVSGDNFVGAVSKKNGKIGTIPLKKAEENIIIGKFKGCGFGQGVTECSIEMKDKTIYISDSSTPESVFKGIDREKWIGKKVKLTGSMDKESTYFIAKSIELVK